MSFLPALYGRGRGYVSHFLRSDFGSGGFTRFQVDRIKLCFWIFGLSCIFIEVLSNLPFSLFFMSFHIAFWIAHVSYFSPLSLPCFTMVIVFLRLPSLRSFSSLLDLFCRPQNKKRQSGVFFLPMSVETSQPSQCFFIFFFPSLERQIAVYSRPNLSSSSFFFSFFACAILQSLRKREKPVRHPAFFLGVVSPSQHSW